MIQSTGIKLDGIYIPPFKLNQGEIVIIQLPNGPNFQPLLFNLVEILTSKKKVENIEVTENLRFVNHIAESRWKSFIAPMTVAKYIRKFGNPESSISSKIYELGWIQPNTKISSLPGNSRKTLSLLITFSWTNKIVFDLAGVDPIGGQQVFNLVKSGIGQFGAAVLIDTSDEFKNDCAKFVKFEIN